MGSYKLAERLAARCLDACPAVRRVAKAAYQRLNYWACAERGFCGAVHPQARLLTPAQWAGTPEHQEEEFFGYYDKTPWSPEGQRALFHRRHATGEVDLRVYDAQAHTCQVVGTPTAWSYQQGSMAQWLPGTDGRRIIYNDVDEGRLVARMVEVDTGTGRVIPWPIQAVHPSGEEAVTLNYRRLHRLRAEYGYAAPVANFAPDQDVREDGLWRVDLVTGQGDLILSLRDLMDTHPRDEMAGAEHKVNHVIYSPGGTRLVFMHRWLGARGKFSRLYVAHSDGSELRLLLDARMVSHYQWQDETHVLAWARTAERGDHYTLLDVTDGSWQIVGEGVLDALGDGHPSYSPDRRWIVTDTYPDRGRQRRLLLYEVATGALTELGRFLAPWAFDGPERCDLHPRWSPGGEMISFDSAHEGRRRTYMLTGLPVAAGDGCL